MKNLRWLLPAAVLVAAIAYIFIKNQNQPQHITNPSDYATYLIPDHLAKAKEQIRVEKEFWNTKLAEDPRNHIYLTKLAGLLAREFRTTGKVESLHESDQILQSINQRLPNQVAVLHLLANNAITQHQFQEAEAYLAEAQAVGNNKFTTLLMMTDVRLERGETMLAKNLLDQMEAENQFDFLIRKMKYEDAKDNLSEAIQAMELAADKAERSGNAALINWSYSNLGDMYGHDGRIEQSYQTYLKALEHNPADLHSLKGIAWVAFSYEHDTEEARRILKFLQSIHPIPDYDLLLAEIAAYEGDEEQTEALEQAFLAKASQAKYGKMYATYLADLASEQVDALALVEEDVTDRPHPVIYDLKAWTLFRQGEQQAAVELWEKQVANQTGEPITAYHAGIMYQAVGNTKMAKKYLREAKAAAFELGPVLSNEVEAQLQAL